MDTPNSNVVPVMPRSVGKGLQTSGPLAGVEVPTAPQVSEESDERMAFTAPASSDAGA